MGASDLWDVACWCGWSSTGNERRELAVDAGTAHYESTRAVQASAKKRKGKAKVAKKAAKQKRTGVIRVYATSRSAKPPATTKERTGRQRVTHVKKTAAASRSPSARKSTKTTDSKASRFPRRVKVAVAGDVRVTVTQTSAHKWRVRCSTCKGRVTKTSRNAAIEHAKRHAIACDRARGR
jgi:hypothetical protein